MFFAALILFVGSKIAFAQYSTGDTAGTAAAELWGARADTAQSALAKYFLSPYVGIYYSNSAQLDNIDYWWQAHALDALVMAYRRTRNTLYSKRMGALYEGMWRVVGFTDNYYDDMEWMALALLRSYEATGNHAYINMADSLWQTIQGAWSDSPGGGGFRWRTLGIYKNVPANAPACILACKLYKDFGDTADLAWAERIHAWIAKNLVNPQSGIILDGISYQDTVGTPSHGSYSYNYGTYLGASLYLYRITGDSTFLNEAEKEADVADSIFATPYGILRSEGTGDGGLFNGIYVYYLAKLVRQLPADDSLRSRYYDFLVSNADSLWESGRKPGTGLFSSNWEKPPSDTVSLSVELSGVTLVESVAWLMGDSAVTAVTPAVSSVPYAFRLYQNYPDPFNPSTRIRISLDRPGQMSLDIYDVLGQLVDVVDKGFKPAGVYSYDIDMDRYASGVYFYTLREGKKEFTRKMLLLK